MRELAHRMLESPGVAVGGGGRRRSAGAPGPGVTTDAAQRIRQLETEDTGLRRRTEFRGRECVLRSGSTRPDGDDPVHQRVQRSSRGRAHLSGPQTGSAGAVPNGLVTTVR